MKKKKNKQIPTSNSNKNKQYLPTFQQNGVVCYKNVRTKLTPLIKPSRFRLFICCYSALFPLALHPCSFSYWTQQGEISVTKQTLKSARSRSLCAQEGTFRGKKTHHFGHLQWTKVALGRCSTRPGGEQLTRTQPSSPHNIRHCK